MTATLVEPTEITKPGIYTMTDETYHSDPVPGGSLSNTGAKRILDSPARFQYEMANPKVKSEFDIGHAVHALVLGVGMDIEVLDFESHRTNAAKAAVAESRAAGRVPLLTKEYAPVKAMAEAALAYPVARKLLEVPGASESSLFAQDPATEVWLRARVDRLPERTGGRTILTDLKTTTSADPREFDRLAEKFGYDVQAEFYQHLVKITRGDKQTAFVFVLVEKDPPHLVSVCHLTSDYVGMGRRKVHRAISVYKHCRDTGEWPGYAPVIHDIEPTRGYVMRGVEGDED